jgi:hypothetical protein
MVKLLFKTLKVGTWFQLWRTTKYIYLLILKIWEYPDVVIIESDDSTEELNILMLKVQWIKKSLYFIFENTIVEEDAVAKCFFMWLKKTVWEEFSPLLNNHIFLK